MPDGLKNRPDVVNAARLISAKIGTINASMTSSARPSAPPISSSDTLDITRRLIHDGKYGDALPYETENACMICQPDGR